MRRRFLPTLTLIVTCLLVTSCAKTSEKTTSHSTVTVESPRTTGIVALGHHAEDLYDQVNVSNWSAASTLLDSLRGDYAASVVGANAATGLGADVSASLARLEQAIPTKDRATGLIESNRLTALSARLLDPAGQEVPADVTLLDYFGREIEVRHAIKDAAGLEAAVDSIDTVWNRVRPAVVARGGSAEAATFDSLVTQLKTAGSPDARAAQAAPILAEVDNLEAVFTRP